MSGDTPSLSDDRRYTALVSARSPEEALDIASEALGPDQPILKTHVEDVSASEGRDSYRVSIWYGPGARRGEPVGG
jgi:hypothetical protein